MPRVLWVLLMVGSLSVAGRLAPAAAVSAQTEAASAAESATLLAELEIAGDFTSLYTLLHPDAQAVVPYEAMAGWYADAFLPRGPYPIEVQTVHFVAWTWAVTGVTYPWTAEVTYHQRFWDDGAETVVEAVVHLVDAGDGLGWRWFFGADASFLTEQIARYVPGVATDGDPAGTLAAAPDLPESLYGDLDAFWAATFAATSVVYTSPGFVSFSGELSTPCGIATAAIGPAVYCPLDATIYWETEWMATLRAERGDFAWVAVIAHEWGHHAQALTGLSRSLAPADLAERFPIELELQADCLSGAYAQDAEWRGLLVAGDVGAATSLAFDSGDAAGVSWYDAGAHGTPEMRVASFLSGYSGGTAACDLPTGDLAA